MMARAQTANGTVGHGMVLSLSFNMLTRSIFMQTKTNCVAYFKILPIIGRLGGLIPTNLMALVIPREIH